MRFHCLILTLLILTANNALFLCLKADTNIEIWSNRNRTEVPIYKCKCINLQIELYTVLGRSAEKVIQFYFASRFTFIQRFIKLKNTKFIKKSTNWIKLIFFNQTKRIYIISDFWKNLTAHIFFYTEHVGKTCYFRIINNIYSAFFWSMRRA